VPYRPGISSIGEDFVGETAALNKKLRRTKGARVPTLNHFDSEDELFDYEQTLTRNDISDNAIIAARKRYQLFWGAVKREQLHDHDTCVPTTQRDWSCGLCRCGQGMTIICRCDDGKKMLSPTRIVFWNSRIAWETRNLIYEVGTGIYVPKKNPDLAPDWRVLDWSI
jgi:hypothetical protein